MNKFTVLITILLSLGISNIYSVPEFIAQAYCKILGNKDASQEQKSKIYEALKALGVENPEKIPVKQMNGFGPAFARINLLSFTAFGFWVDETYLNQLTKEEAIFLMYHEAAHYALGHHQQILTGTAIAIPATSAIVLGLDHLLRLKNMSLTTRMLGAIGVIIGSLLSSYFFVLPEISKQQEKEADLKAAELLISMGKWHIVKEHVKHLKNIASDDDENTWWHSTIEQFFYLR